MESQISKTLTLIAARNAGLLFFAINCYVAPVRAQDAGNTYLGTLTFSGTLVPALNNPNQIWLPASGAGVNIMIHTGSRAVGNLGRTASEATIDFGAGTIAITNSNPSQFASWPPGTITANSSWSGSASPLHPGGGSTPFRYTYSGPMDVFSTATRRIQYTVSGSLVGGGGVSDTVYFQYTMAGQFRVVAGSGAPNQPAVGQAIVSPVTLHFYLGADIPPGGREGIDDQLTVKCAFYVGEGVLGQEVKFFINGNPYVVGRTLGGRPDQKQPFELTKTETQQGGPLEGVPVEVYLGDTMVFSDTTPATFPSHVHTMDGGTHRLICGCVGQCVLGHTKASVSQ